MEAPSRFSYPVIPPKAGMTDWEGNHPLLDAGEVFLGLVPATLGLPLAGAWA